MRCNISRYKTQWEILRKFKVNFEKFNKFLFELSLVVMNPEPSFVLFLQNETRNFLPTGRPRITPKVFLRFASESSSSSSPNKERRKNSWTIANNRRKGKIFLLFCFFNKNKAEPREAFGHWRVRDNRSFDWLQVTQKKGISISAPFLYPKPQNRKDIRRKTIV